MAVIEYHDVLQPMLDGDLDAAEQSTTDALTLGAKAGYPGSDPSTAPSSSALRWMQGRVHEMLPLIEEAVSDNPELEIFRAVTAWDCA